MSTHEEKRARLAALLREAEPLPGPPREWMAPDHASALFALSDLLSRYSEPEDSDGGVLIRSLGDLVGLLAETMPRRQCP